MAMVEPSQSSSSDPGKHDLVQESRKFGFLRRLLYLFLLARLTLVVVTISNPFRAILADSVDYLDLAVALAEEGHYSHPRDLETELVRPPGYPAVLAAVRLVLGPETHWITLLNLALSGVTCLLILSVGIRVSKPIVGLAGAWIYALSPNVALWSLTVMSEVLFAFLIVLTAWITLRMVERSSIAWSPVTGAFLGLLAYIRTIALVLLPTWTLTTYWISQAKVGKRKALTASVLLLLAGVITIVPWAYRNWSTQGIFTFSTVSTKTWVGFNLAHVVARGEGIDRNSAVGLLDHEIGTLQLTLNVIKDYPLEFLESQTLGLARTVAGTEVGTWGFVLDRDAWRGFGFLGNGSRRSVGQALNDALDWSGPDGGGRFALNVYSLMFSLTLMSLAGIGIITFRSSEMPERLVYFGAVASIVILLIIPGAAGQARFRVPAEPYLALLAGYGWFALSTRFTRVRALQENLDIQEDLIHAS